VESKYCLYVSLGNGRFVVVKIRENNVQLHVRQYDLGKNGELYPTKTGMFLTPGRFANLIHNTEEINEAVKKFGEKEAEFDIKIHLGAGWYVTVKNNFKCVNFRRFFTPDDQIGEIPTKFGIALRLSEWNAFTSVFDEIIEKVPEFKNPAPCYCSELLNCAECAPFVSAKGME